MDVTSTKPQAHRVPFIIELNIIMQPARLYANEHVLFEGIGSICAEIDTSTFLDASRGLEKAARSHMSEFATSQQYGDRFHHLIEQAKIIRYLVIWYGDKPTGYDQSTESEDGATIQSGSHTVINSSNWKRIAGMMEKREARDRLCVEVRVTDEVEEESEDEVTL